jgi:hypothetical protein
VAKEDIVDAFMRCLLEEAPETPAVAVRAIAKRLRTEWGGREVYVLKRAVDARVERLGTALAGAESLGHAMKAAGLPRRTGHRLLKRKTLATDW